VVFDLFGTLTVQTGDAMAPEYEGQRKEAEHIAAGRNGAPDIHNVYAEFRRLTGMSAQECERLKAQEFDRLLLSCKPRTVVVEMLNALIGQRAEVVVAEDTVWTPAYIRKLLRHCGVDDAAGVCLSNDTGNKKSDGSLYDYCKNRFQGRPFLNVGDEELTDVQIPNQRRIHALHVMHPDNMAKIAGFRSGRMVDDPFCLLELLQESALNQSHERQEANVG